MKRLIQSLCAAAIAAVISLGFTTASDAALLDTQAQAQKPLPIKAAKSNKGVKVAGRGRRYKGFRGHRGYRGYRSSRRRGRRNRNIGRGIAIGIGALILGTIIANEAARAHNRGGYNAVRRRCARDFRSYDWETDTIVGYDGAVRICPYLR